jgi:hypothetical protein
MLKIHRAALLLACGLAFAAGPAQALQVVVTHMDKNADGSTTYQFAVKTAEGESLTPGSDFVTVYNFGAMVEGSAKSPEGWSFASKEFGETPTWNGYPVVAPVDIPGLSNLTWSVSKPVAGGSEIDGFSATTRSSRTMDGEYTAQVTREQPAAGDASAKQTKQAIIGHLPTPSYLAH